MKEKNEVMEDFKNVLGYWEEAQERNKDKSRVKLYDMCKKALAAGAYSIKLHFDGAGDSWEWVDVEYYDKAEVVMSLKDAHIKDNDLQSAAENFVCQAGFSGNDEGGVGYVTIDCLSLKTEVVLQWREVTLSDEEVTTYDI